jgi:protein gp37
MGHNPKTPQYRGLTTMTKAGPVWTGKVRLVEHKLEEPLKRRKPTMYFVNSMSDLVHGTLRDAAIDRVFAVMDTVGESFKLNADAAQKAGMLTETVRLITSTQKSVPRK